MGYTTTHHFTDFAQLPLHAQSPVGVLLTRTRAHFRKLSHIKVRGVSTARAKMKRTHHFTDFAQLPLHAQSPVDVLLVSFSERQRPHTGVLHTTQSLP